jgi:hypothetical protein
VRWRDPLISWKIGYLPIKFLSENIRGGIYVIGTDVYYRIIMLKWVLIKWHMKMWTVFVRLRIGSNNWLL